VAPRWLTLERQVELVRRELLGARPELLAPEQGHDALEPLLRLLGVRQRRLDLCEARLQQHVLAGEVGSVHAPIQADGGTRRYPRRAAESLRRTQPAMRGRRLRSGRTSRQSSPSKSAANWAGDIPHHPVAHLRPDELRPLQALVQ
jgi:hypothetical protein